MNVLELKVNIFMLKDINLIDVQEKIATLIDKSFLKDVDLKEFHEKNTYKLYCFDLPYPIEKDKVYFKDKVYSIRIRTINEKLANHFLNVLVNEYTKDIKALNAQIRIIPKKHFEKIYCLTPAIIKSEKGYWKGNLSLADYEKNLFVNLVKKYNLATGQKLNEDFQFYKRIEFINKKPIPVKYKNIKLLGDKISLLLDDNKRAQDLAYFSLASGFLENNGRGAGFLNYRYL